MKNRITRSTALVLAVICLVTIVLLGRHHALDAAMAQSQDKPQKWEYCYVSSPFLLGTAGGISTKVYVSRGAEKWMEDSDSTGVSVLNKLGADGWELVSASDELILTGGPPSPPVSTRFLMKRPK